MFQLWGRVLYYLSTDFYLIYTEFSSSKLLKDMLDLVSYSLVVHVQFNPISVAERDAIIDKIMDSEASTLLKLFQLLGSVLYLRVQKVETIGEARPTQ